MNFEKLFHRYLKFNFLRTVKFLIFKNNFCGKIMFTNSGEFLTGFLRLKDRHSFDRQLVDRQRYLYILFKFGSNLNCRSNDPDAL
jgi:hypothetical protein